jgi:nicotinamidase-related amidase
MTDLPVAKIHLKPSGALLVVDIQNDFLPDGALNVAGGDEIVPVLNRCVTLFQARDLPVFFTRDWHTPGHCSLRDGCAGQDAGGFRHAPCARRAHRRFRHRHTPGHI